MALLNEILGWDIGTNAAYEGLGQCDAGVQQNCNRATTGRGAGGCVDFSISEGSSDIPACASAGGNIEIKSCANSCSVTTCALENAWKAPRTEEFAETNHSNVVPMDVDSLHRKGGKGKKGKSKGKNNGDRRQSEQSVKQRYFDGCCNQSGKKNQTVRARTNYIL